jgi:hypothetical protein
MDEDRALLIVMATEWTRFQRSPSCDIIQEVGGARHG